MCKVLSVSRILYQVPEKIKHVRENKNRPDVHRGGFCLQYSKDSPNAFRRLRRRGIPPAKIRKVGGAAPLIISGFSLAAKLL
jgi:hypothetical protein